MRQIELPGRTLNVDDILRFSESLKKNFAPVRIRFYKADLRPRANFMRPANVFRAEPERANYIKISLNNRDAVEFYKGRGLMGGNIFDENLNDYQVQVVLSTLARHRAQNMPAPAIKVMAPTVMPVEKPFYSVIFEWFENLLARLKS